MPGIPKVLIGNRLHLEFQRQVDQSEAIEYAEKHAMGFFEISPLVNFNVCESFVELARMALKRNGMERLWRSNKGNDFLNKQIGRVTRNSNAHNGLLGIFPMKKS